MTEEGQVEASETTETTETPTSMLKEDGSFVENWTHRLKDESLHDDATLKTLKSIDALAGNHVLQRKKIGANTIIAPNEQSTDAEWEAFHDAGGRPITAADYNLTRPEGLPTELYPPERLTQAQELFHKIGISTKQANALFEFDKAVAMTALKAKQDADELAFNELKDNLYQEWGNAFQQKKHLGDVAVNEGSNGDDEFKTRLCDKFGNDPDFIRLLSNLGSKFVERGAIVPDSIPTPGDIQQKINEGVAHPAYMDGKHPQHKNQVLLVAKLFRDKAANTKTG